MNCEKCLLKCKAECCGIIPIPKEIYKKFPSVREATSCEELGDIVLAHDKDGYCPYLDEKFNCSIYENRPDVCKKYGDESHLLMTCKWQNKNGKLRGRAERRRIERIQNKEQNKTLKKMQKLLFK